MYKYIYSNYIKHIAYMYESVTVLSVAFFIIDLFLNF